jgi:hypothetical protein
MSLTETGSRVIGACRTHPKKFSSVVTLFGIMSGIIAWQQKRIDHIEAKWEAVMERLIVARNSPEIDLAATVDKFTNGAELECVTF